VWEQADKFRVARADARIAVKRGFMALVVSMANGGVRETKFQRCFFVG
jgi:hypothetical protein